MSLSPIYELLITIMQKLISCVGIDLSGNRTEFSELWVAVVAAAGGGVEIVVSIATGDVDRDDYRTR